MKYIEQEVTPKNTHTPGTVIKCEGAYYIITDGRSRERFHRDKSTTTYLVNLATGAETWDTNLNLHLYTVVERA